MCPSQKTLTQQRRPHNKIICHVVSRNHITTPNILVVVSINKSSQRSYQTNPMSEAEPTSSEATAKQQRFQCPLSKSVLKQPVQLHCCKAIVSLEWLLLVMDYLSHNDLQAAGLCPVCLVESNHGQPLTIVKLQLPRDLSPGPSPHRSEDPGLGVPARDVATPVMHPCCDRISDREHLLSLFNGDETASVQCHYCDNAYTMSLAEASKLPIDAIHIEKMIRSGMRELSDDDDSLPAEDDAHSRTRNRTQGRRRSRQEAFPQRTEQQRAADIRDDYNPEIGRPASFPDWSRYEVNDNNIPLKSNDIFATTHAPERAGEKLQPSMFEGYLNKERVRDLLEIIDHSTDHGVIESNNLTFDFNHFKRCCKEGFLGCEPMASKSCESTFVDYERITDAIFFNGRGSFGEEKTTRLKFLTDQLDKVHSPGDYQPSPFIVEDTFVPFILVDFGRLQDMHRIFVREIYHKSINTHHLSGEKGFRANYVERLHELLRKLESYRYLLWQKPAARQVYKDDKPTKGGKRRFRRELS